jgi:hypothetical protein
MAQLLYGTAVAETTGGDRIPSTRSLAATVKRIFANLPLGLAGLDEKRGFSL